MRKIFGVSERKRNGVRESEKGNRKEKALSVSQWKNTRNVSDKIKKKIGGMEMYIDAFFDGMAVVIMAELITGFLCSFLFRKRDRR